MEKTTILVARGLSVTFLSEVVTETHYEPPESPCSNCASECGTGPRCGARALTVHRLSDGVLTCESQTETRTLAARFVVTDRGANDEYPTIRAFKDGGELVAWMANVCHQLPEVQRSIEEGILRVA